MHAACALLPTESERDRERERKCRRETQTFSPPPGGINFSTSYFAGCRGHSREACHTAASFAFLPGRQTFSKSREKKFVFSSACPSLSRSLHLSLPAKEEGRMVEFFRQRFIASRRTDAPTSICR